MLDGVGVPWWVAGGHAVDLTVGRTTRFHEDVDVAVLRRDQRLLFEQLRGWDLMYAMPDHGLRRWHGHWLDLPVHGIWVRRSPDAWFCELLLQESDGADWVYRRDPRVRRPLADIGRVATGVPALAPEIVLLYKAKDPRERDDSDFQAVLPAMSRDGRTWLADAISTAHPGHPWLDALD